MVSDFVIKISGKMTNNRNMEFGRPMIAFFILFEIYKGLTDSSSYEAVCKRGIGC